MSDLGLAVYAAALAWHEAGASVVPCTDRGGKRPLLDWKPLQTTRLSLPALRGYFSAGHRDGFGIIPGFGGFEMFEVEGRAVLDDTLSEFFKLMRDNAPELLAKLGAGYVEHTPSGGIHWIYLVDGAPARNTKLAANERGECLIETRGEGGFVVLAPSAGKTHLEIPGGEWKTARKPSQAVVLSVSERDQLYAVAEMLNRNARVDAGPGPSGSGTGVVGRGEGSPIDDYNSNGDWSILVEYGWRISSTDDHGTTYWIRPGKEDSGDSSHTHSASTRENSPNLYIWSTSVKGLAAEVPHSRAYVRAHYKHAGNLGACRAELAGRGFGKPESEAGRVDDWAAADKLAWAEERAVIAEQARAALQNAFATPEEVEAAEAVLEAAVAALKGQRFYASDELDEIEPPTPLIEGVLDVASTAILSGMFGTYKTFAAVAWACCVATGTAWGPHAVPVARKVLYVAAEGASGLNGRIKAWAKANGVHPKAQLIVFPRPVKVMDDEALLEIEQFVHDNEVGLLVLDTMRRMTPGIEENSSTEMGAAMANVDGIRERQSCAVLWVHHTGHIGSRTRGTSSIEDDSDICWIIELEDGDSRQPENRRILKQRKVKDGELAEDRPLTFKVEQVETRRGTKSSGWVEPSPNPFEKKTGGREQVKVIPVTGAMLNRLLAVIAREPDITATGLERHEQLVGHGSRTERVHHLGHLLSIGLVKKTVTGSGPRAAQKYRLASSQEIKATAPELAEVREEFAKISNGQAAILTEEQLETMLKSAGIGLDPSK